MSRQRGRHRRDFDAHAAAFDRQAGLGDDVAMKVADAVIKLIRPTPGDVVLELGAGTWEIGRHLACADARYIGLDASAEMLGVGRARHRVAKEAPSTVPLVVGDCDQRWPIRDGVVRCVFASRVAHLLDGAHVTREILRVGQPRVFWIMGRTRRDPEGYRELLRDHMRQMLRDRGIQPRGARSSGARLVEAMAAAGGVPLEPVSAATWIHRGTALDMLSAWRARGDLAGVPVDADVREAVLNEVERWAVRRFGDVTTVMESREDYILSAMRFNNARPVS